MASIIGTVLIGGRLVSMLSTLGIDVIIKTITSATSSIGGVLRHLASMDQPSVQEMMLELNKLDLEHIVGVIEELVKEQSDKDAKESVKKALLGVSDILDEIHKELLVIKESADYHATQWFTNWRAFNCSVSIATLQRHRLILDERYKIMIDLLQLYN